MSSGLLQAFIERQKHQRKGVLENMLGRQAVPVAHNHPVYTPSIDEQRLVALAPLNLTAALPVLNALSFQKALEKPRKPLQAFGKAKGKATLAMSVHH